MTERSPAARVRDSVRVTILVALVALAFWALCYGIGEPLDSADMSVVVALAAGLVLGSRAVYARVTQAAARHPVPNIDDAGPNASDRRPSDAAADRAPRARRRPRRP